MAPPSARSPAIPALLALHFLRLFASPAPSASLSDDGADMPESVGAKPLHQRHAFNLLEPELAEAVWNREGLRNPLRRTTTIPFSAGAKVDHPMATEQQKNKLVLVKRMPRALPAISEYDALNSDFLTEYDLLNLDFSLDPDEDKKSPRGVEVPAKEFEVEEKPKEHFPPKEWWDLEEPAEVTVSTAGRGLLGESSEGQQRKETGRKTRIRRDLWSEEAVEREMVKIWPRLVPSSSVLPPPEQMAPVPRPAPSSQPMASSASLPPGSPRQTTTMANGPIQARNRISGDGPQFPDRSKKGKAGGGERGKQELFRDLPTGVQVLSNFVEKAVIGNGDSSQQSRTISGPPQHEKAVPPPLAHQFSRVANLVSPSSQQEVRHPFGSIPNQSSLDGSAGYSRHFGQLSSPFAGQTNSESQPTDSPNISPNQRRIDRIIESFPTIVVGDQQIAKPNMAPIQPHQQKSFISSANGHPLQPGLLSQQFLAGKGPIPSLGQIGQSLQFAPQSAASSAPPLLQRADQQNGGPQQEVAPAEHLVPALDLPQDDPIPPSSAPPLPPGFVHLATLDSLPKDGHLQIGNQRYQIEQIVPFRHFHPPSSARDSDFKVVLPQLIDLPSLEQTTQSPAGLADADIRNSTMTVTGAEADGNGTAQRVAPRQRGDTLRQFGERGPKGFSGKAGTLALNLSSALSQIFGNFSVGHIPFGGIDEKAKSAAENARSGGEGDGIEEVPSEPHQLTRVFEKKAAKNNNNNNNNNIGRGPNPN